jgi:hypothetical protein
MTMNFFHNFEISPEKKKIFILNAIRYTSLFMLVLGYIIIIFFIAGGKI